MERRLKNSYRRKMFPHEVVNKWNGLDKRVVCAEKIHEFKAMLDAMRYRDRTA